MTIVGGLRARLLYDSLYNEIERALTELGWFDPGRSHLPVRMINQPVPESEEIQLNTLVLYAEDGDTLQYEVGSDLSEHRRTFYLDLYAENISVGEHLIFDCQAILEGRMRSVGRTSHFFDVYDYTQATPPVIAVAEIGEDVIIDRAVRYSFPWQKNWYSCQFTVSDYYGNEDDDA
jgi:hypothetical protein